VLEIDDGVTVPISDHGKGIFVDVAKSISITDSHGPDPDDPANGYISGLDLVAPKNLRDVFSAATPPTVPNDITVTVDNDSGELSIIAQDSDGNPTALDASGDPLDLTPTPVPKVGEEFEVAGMKLKVNDAVFDTASGNGDSFTIGISDKQSVFGTIENVIDGLEGIAKG
ncbi:MAG: hypothetical protein RI567_14555, partial [Marinobacter sp.]|nr:hypothetical protein [Marinobacter sp.]